jgi:hypothetical protein
MFFVVLLYYPNPTANPNANSDVMRRWMKRRSMPWKRQHQNACHDQRDTAKDGVTKKAPKVETDGITKRGSKSEGALGLVSGTNTIETNQV